MLYLFGGCWQNPGETSRAQVCVERPWKSPDGVHWYESNPTSPPRKVGEQVVLYANGAFRQYGGKSVEGFRIFEVYVSKDEDRWELLTFPNNPALRNSNDSSLKKNNINQHSGVYFNNWFWIIGGVDNGYSWCSRDGISWVRAGASEASRRRFGKAVVLENTLFVLGGVHGEPAKRALELAAGTAPVWSTTETP